MSKLTIKTNNVPRNMLYGYELPTKWRSEFDWLDDEQFSCENFIKYKGYYYALSEFMNLHNTGTPEFKSWHGYHGDSFFSGIVIKLCDNEQVIVGEYSC